jgi:toxin ParE1/3/4
LASGLVDLKSIYLYVLDKSSNAAVASSFTNNRIVDRAERIGDAPNGGAPRPDLGQGVRLVPFERSTVIIYRVASATVEIVNVFYGGRDYEALLRGQSDGK